MFWFHRSILKATTLINFNDILFGTFGLTKLGSELKKARDRILSILPDPSHTVDTMNTAFVTYLSLMSGFFMDYKISGRKIRYSYMFKWTNSLLGKSTLSQEDAAFDIANMAINVGLWYMKHASYTASKNMVSLDNSKEIHSSLRKAAGIFQMVERDLLPVLQPGDSGSDLDYRVMNAYCLQCTAEAQEVTVNRAIELQHSDNLISSLAYETASLFESAKDNLKGLNKNISEQWMLYLEIKRNVYFALAYCYSGKNLLHDDHCGEAIRNLQEARMHYNKADQLCKSYSKVKGPAKPVKPDGHPFFKEINSILNLTLDKCERENGLIYHQKIPEFPVSLEKKETYGLASPETCILPSPSPLWENAFEGETQNDSQGVTNTKQHVLTK